MLSRTQPFNCVRAVHTGTKNANVITQIAKLSFRRWINLYDTLHSQFTSSFGHCLEFRTRKAHGTHRFTLTQLQYSLVPPLPCRAACVTAANISE